MLSVRNLTKKYGQFEVLKGIDFQVEKGTIYGFLGKNGAGKTTTMNILTGLISYNSGCITYNGTEIKPNKKNMLRNIGYAPQSPVFYGYMNAYEYLNFVGELSGMSKENIVRRSDEVLLALGLKDAAKRRLSVYSGGMKQRFGVAVVLFNRPELLFLDEPTASLDPEGRMEMLSLIKSLKDDGITVFLSTHILNDVERICDEVSILDVYPYSKGGNPTAIVLAKFVHYSLVICVLITLGFLINYYYINLLLRGDSINLTDVLSAGASLCLYYIMNFSMALFFSSIFKKGIIAGFITLFLQYLSIAFIGIKIVSKYMPYNIVNSANMLTFNNINLTIFMIIIYIVIFISATVYRMHKVEVI